MPGKPAPRLATLMLLFLSLGALCHCQPAGPPPSPAAKLYQAYCATCHGVDLSGGNSSTLFDDEWAFGSSEAEIARNIREGILEQGMPAYGQRFDEQQIASLVDYLKAGGAPAPQPTPEKESRQVETLDYVLRVEHWIPAEAGLREPWGIDFLDARRALVTEKPGPLRLVEDGRLHPDPIAGTPPVVDGGQGGMLDVAVDPDYAENGWVYLAYSHLLDADDPRGPAMTRIVRGRIADHRWTDQQVLWQAADDHYWNTRHHYGCRIVFGPDGHLYFPVGDRGRRDWAQRLDTPNGKVHRISRDGQIPPDNPFTDRQDALPSIFSYGHRNPQGMAFHPDTGELWLVEHGPRGGDELNRCLPGLNYGWPVITYGIEYSGKILTDRRHAEGMEQPNLYWRPSTAVSGLDFYDADPFPLWRGKLLVSSLRQEELRLLDLYEQRVMHQETILAGMGRIRESITGPDGAIYVVLNAPNEILRLSSEGRREY